MRDYSSFTTEYVNDICNVLKTKGVLVNNKPFEPENFETLTTFLQDHIVRSLDIFTYLDDLGLVNKGKCPYTGQRIDNTFPSWSFMNSRRVYCSHEGYAIMKKEDDELYEKVMGFPKSNPSTSSPKSGCYIATACYGNEYAPEVLALKLYRDNTLKKSLLGRLFIKTYYLISPPIADKLKNMESLNSFVREKILNKIVNKIK